MANGSYSEDRKLLAKSEEILVKTDVNTEELLSAHKDLCSHYKDLINQTEVLTNIGDKLQNKLNTANNKLEIRNNQLRRTIDELTRAKVSKRAQSITIFIAIVLFLLSESLIDPVIDRYTQNPWYNILSKVVIALIFKPLESFLEKRMLQQTFKNRLRLAQHKPE